MSLQIAAELCAKLEPLLRAKKMHVALTGSTLYGMGSKHDIDLLVYPHRPDRASVDFVEVFKALESVGATLPEPAVEYGGTTVYPKGGYQGVRLDIFAP